MTVTGTAPRDAAAPSRRSRSSAAVIVALVVTVAAAALWYGAAGATSAGSVRLEIVDPDAGDVHASFAVEVGDRFVLEHTHSVTERVVRETYSVQHGPTVAIEELWFDEPGPNLPSGSEPVGDGMTTFLHEGGEFRVLHHGHDIGSIALLNGSEGVGHVLNLPDGERVRLLDVVRAGAAIEVRAVEG